MPAFSLQFARLVLILCALFSAGRAQASPPEAVSGEQVPDARAAADYQYRQEALSFGDQVTLITNGKTLFAMKTKVAYQGEHGRRLDGEELFDLLGRDDLVEAYARRRSYTYAGLLGGTAGLIVGMTLLRHGIGSENGAVMFGGGVVSAGGIAAFAIGAYYAVNPNPVSDEELYDLVDGYNLDLRKQYGLVRIAPYVDNTGGGMLASGRF